MQLFRTKSVEQTIAETGEEGRKLKRNLTWWDLSIMGVAVAVGAGIFSVGAQAAAFHTLKSGSQQVSDLFGTRQTQRITAGWSFPRGVESPRAYVFYDALRGQDGWVIESWANYVCQTAPVYPFRDAAALWHSYGSDAYDLRQTALQVFDG